MQRFKVGMDYPTLSMLYRDWINRNGDGRDHQDQRFGQFLCTHYLVPDATWPELFFEESSYQAFCIAMVKL